jgi:hypothetical protein
MASLKDKLLTNTVIDLEPPPEPGRRPIFRMSHSSNDLLARCERKYQLSCCIPQSEEEKVGAYADLPFGKAVGTGFQKYVETKDLDAALFATLLAYHPLVEDADTKQNRKFLERAFLAVESLSIKWDESGYELLYLGDPFAENPRPVIELGFKILLNDYGDYFCGFADIGMWNPSKGQPGIIEVKTTGLNRDDLSPIYKYSPQALGYSTVLDTILPYGENFETIYFVSHLHRGEVWPESRILPYQKTRLDRLNWMMVLITDLNKAIACYENNFWPQRWQECLAYNRVCQYFETCNMASWNEEQIDMGEEFGMPYNEGTDWEFVFTLKELFDKTVKAEG